MKKTTITIFFFSLIYGFTACNSDMSKSENKQVTATENTSTKSGQAVYKAYCLACHGKNGSAKLAGAKDLTVSKLSEAETKTIIEQGSKNKKMLAYGKLLKTSDLEAVTAYVMSLRK